MHQHFSLMYSEFFGFMESAKISLHVSVFFCWPYLHHGSTFSRTLFFTLQQTNQLENGAARFARCPSALLQGIWVTYPDWQTFTYATLDSGKGSPFVKVVGLFEQSPKERRGLATWSSRRWSAWMIPKFFFLNRQPLDNLKVISNDLWTLMIQNITAMPHSLMVLLRSWLYSANDNGKRRHLKMSSNDHRTLDILFKQSFIDTVSTLLMRKRPKTWDTIKRNHHH